MGKLQLKAVSLITCIMFILTMIPVKSTVHATDVLISRNADVVFLIDGTGSMQDEIDSVRDNISAFLTKLTEEKVDVRVRFIIFKNMEYQPIEQRTTWSEWYTSGSAAKEYLSKVVAYGGGPGLTPYETPVDGIGFMLSASFGFRSNTSKFCIMISDEESSPYNTWGIGSEDEAALRIEQNNIHTSIIVDEDCHDTFDRYLTKPSKYNGNIGGVKADIKGEYSYLLTNYVHDAMIDDLYTATVDYMTPPSGPVGSVTRVKVYADHLNYNSPFKVSLGDRVVNVINKKETYFEFDAPNDIPEGFYNVEITNGEKGKVSSAGDFQYKPVSDSETPGFLEAFPYKFEEFKDVSITITGNNFISPKVFIGDTEVSSTMLSTSKLTIKTGTKLKSGKYNLRIVNNNGKSIEVKDAFNVIYAAIQTPPITIPTNLMAVPRDRNVVLNWEPVAGATRYYVYKDGVKVDGPTGTTYTASFLTNGRMYTFGVSAYDGKNESGKATVKVAPIEDISESVTAPTNLIGTAGDKKVTLKWDAVAGATRYYVYKDGVKLDGPTTNTYTATGLTNGKTYTFEVSAYDGKNESGKATVKVAPIEDISESVTAPTNLIGTAGDKKVTLKWDAVAGATRYYVYKDGVKLDGPTTNTYTATGLTNGKTYTFAVSAYDGKNESEKSTVQVALNVQSTPAITAPTNLTGIAGDKKLTLKWDAVAGATRYYVYKDGVKLDGPTTNTYTATGLTNGKTYTFTVSAYNGKVESAKATVKVTLSAQSTPAITAPTNLTGIAGDKKLTLKWDAVAGATRYYVYKDGVKLDGPTTNTYTATGLTNGKTYTFTVSAYNGKVESAKATVKVTLSAQSAPAITSPTNLTGTAGDRKVTLKWDAVAGATRYYVYKDGVKLDGPTTNTYTATGLTNGKTYTFTVSAYNGKVESAKATAKVTLNAQSAPAITSPTNLTGTAGDRKVTLKWDAVAGATRYYVYKDGVKLDGPTTNTYTATGLTNGKTYTFTVSAYDGKNESEKISKTIKVE